MRPTCVVILLLFLALVAPKFASAQVLSIGIDIDDTTLNMITKIYLKSLKGGDEIAVDTHTFGRERPNIGKSGPYADYSISLEDHTGSYRDFRDGGIQHPSQSPFVRDLQKAIDQQGGVPKGPLFDLLQLVLSEPSLLPWVKKITTRGHERRSIHYGFQMIQSLGELRYAPLLENIYPVSSDEFGGSTHLISDRKLAIELNDLMKIAKLRVDGNGLVMRSPDGLNRGRYHVKEFWDDDLKTDALAKRLFGDWMREHPEAPVKIVKRRPYDQGGVAKVENLVFTPDGGSRLMMNDEYGELPRLVRRFERLRLAGRGLSCLEVLTKRQGLPVETLQTDLKLLHSIR